MHGAGLGMQGRREQRVWGVRTGCARVAEAGDKVRRPAHAYDSTLGTVRVPRVLMVSGDDVVDARSLSAAYERVARQWRVYATRWRIYWWATERGEIGMRCHSLDRGETGRWRGMGRAVDDRCAVEMHGCMKRTNGELRPSGSGGSRPSKRPGVKTAATSLVYGTLLAPGVVRGAAGLERCAVVGSESAPKIKIPGGRVRPGASLLVAHSPLMPPPQSMHSHASAFTDLVSTSQGVHTTAFPPASATPSFSAGWIVRNPHVPPPSPPHTRSFPLLPLIILGFALVLALLSYLPNVLSLRPQFSFLLPPSALILFRPSLHPGAAIFLFFRISLDPPTSRR
ncbi:hypothetical protein DFH08DRAFT_977856 [Mycena albidolilacea]|uniref:Uncharacterized protein n=1 Tax=Mycena albidolilacea TaxID=1033008 RepID=A0AAD7E914_9AGAR|nr:hypothetical protein DFH08DRAFT_977856 [Mycena albidolilacea]